MELERSVHSQQKQGGTSSASSRLLNNPIHTNRVGGPALEVSWSHYIEKGNCVPPVELVEMSAGG